MKKKMNTMGKLEKGLLAMGVAAAAGYYFYKSKDVKKHRKLAAAWARDFKKEVEKRTGEFEKISRAAISTAVDKTVSAYRRRGKYRDEIMDAANELKKNWQALQKEVMRRAKSPSRKSKS